MGGVVTVDGVTLSGLRPEVRSALDALAAEVRAAGLAPLVITSARRSDAGQARAMLGKLEAGGEGELRQTYRRGIGPEVVSALLDAPRDADAWADVLAGFPPVSAHQDGRAVDVRVWVGAPGSSPRRDDIAQIQALAEGLGWLSLVEPRPPHLHLERPR